MAPFDNVLETSRSQNGESIHYSTDQQHLKNFCDLRAEAELCTLQINQQVSKNEWNWDWTDKRSHDAQSSAGLSIILSKSVSSFFHKDFNKKSHHFYIRYPNTKRLHQIMGCTLKCSRTWNSIHFHSFTKKEIVKSYMFWSDEVLPLVRYLCAQI